MKLINPKQLKSFLLLTVVVFIYTVFFQSMYCWIKYNNPIGGFGWSVYLNSIPYNFIPMLAITVTLVMVLKKTMTIERLWLKIMIDAMATVLSVIIVNVLFPVITGLPINWGGTIFNGVLILLASEFYLGSEQKRRLLIVQSMLREEILVKKFEVMKAYVSPHFLYNSLDMLCSMIEEDEKNESIDFSIELSSFYRNICMIMNQDRISLKREIDIVRRYYNILRYHYRENLTLKVEGDVSSNVSLVPLSIQLMVENVIKHNIIDSEHPMVIRIIIDENKIVIENDYNSKESVCSDGTGIGLNYLKSQYDILGKSFSIDKSSGKFKVELPNIN